MSHLRSRDMQRGCEKNEPVRFHRQTCVRILRQCSGVERWSRLSIQQASRHTPSNPIHLTKRVVLE